MYMSDDRLKSNFHRIPAPNADRFQGRRHTMAFFTNPNLDAVLQVLPVLLPKAASMCWSGLEGGNKCFSLHLLVQRK